MKKILTVSILLAAVSVFAESDKKPVATVTNVVTVTNGNGIVTTGKAPEKADAYTGATRKAKKQKQANP